MNENIETSGNEFATFDVDDFDWDGEAAPSVPPDFDLVEAAMTAAAAVNRRSFGWSWVDQLKPSRKKLFKVNVVMPEEHREWFEKTWPEYAFQWDAASVHHDHPRSHLATELNEIEATARLVAKGTPYVDLFGNPGRNAKYARNCLTLYSRMCPRDFVRYQHAHEFPNARELDWARLVKGEYHIDGKRIHDLVMTHSLYYVPLRRVAQFVNAHPLNRVHAVVHRHPMSRGELNAGELQYVVSEDGVVTQTNRETGEKYVHPSLEALFHQFDAKTEDGGIAWTVRKLGGDTFLMEFVGCPRDMCGDFVPFTYLKPTTRTEESFCNVTVRRFLHFTWSYVSREGRRVLLEDEGLLTKLRRYQSGRLRGARQKTELMQYARRLSNKEDIISIHGGEVHEVATGELCDYVEAAFYMDVHHELETALSHSRDNANVVAALNAYIEGGKVPRDLSLPARVVRVIGTGALLPFRLPDHVAEVVDRVGRPVEYDPTKDADGFNPFDAFSDWGV